jgi:hypothetical protein
MFFKPPNLFSETLSESLPLYLATTGLLKNFATPRFLIGSAKVGKLSQTTKQYHQNPENESEKRRFHSFYSIVSLRTAV